MRSSSTPSGKGIRRLNAEERFQEAIQDTQFCRQDKVTYSSPQAAQRVIQDQLSKAKASALRYYWCVACDGWHITSKPKREP